MRWETFVSLRHLRARSAEAFLSAISLMSTGGVVLGVAALVVVLAVMTGFETDLKDRILAVTSHAWVMRQAGPMEEYAEISEKLMEMPEVTAAAPFIHGQVMARSAKAVSGVIVKGIDPVLSGPGTGFGLSGLLREGSLSDLAPPETGEPGIILGTELARTLGVSVGQPLYLIAPESGVRSMSTLPRMSRFTVVGLLETGMYEYDNVLAWTGLPAASRLFGMDGAVTGVEVCLADVLAARETAREISKRLGYAYFARDWSRMNENLFAALKMEKAVMAVILSLIVLVAAFNIAGTLIMSVMDKRREIAILKAMGATRGAVMRVFVTNGMLIGAAGAFLGLVLAGVVCYLLSRYQFIHLDPKVYPLATMPVDMRLADVLWVTGGALAVSFLATLYPAWRASRLDPVEIIRYG